MTPPHVLSRLRNVPTRLFAAMLSFGGMLGAPAALVLLAALLFATELPVAGVAVLLLAFVVFAGFVIGAWVLIFQAKSRLLRAEQALYAGDFDAASRDALFVVRTVFRSDYQMGALFTLALAAERIGAFAEAAMLFTRALEMIPLMAASRPGRRARALVAAHAALDFAAANDLPRATAMLASCHAQLGERGQPGAFDALLDDSAMGAIGINSILLELENRREPRPLAVLASLLVAFKHGHLHQVLHLLAAERGSLHHFLAPHERALAERIHDEAMRLTSGGGPHRSPSALAPDGQDMAAGWASRVLPSVG